MKGKAKGGGTKAVAKEVMPAIEGLGTGVPDPVRDAYLALVQSEPEDRPGAVVALRAAVMGNKSAASHLALAKGLIYRAMDTAVITKAHSKDVWAQMARDKDATKILQEALKEAAEGANKYKSQLCFMLAAHLAAMLSDIPFVHFFDEDLRRLIGRHQDILSFSFNPDELATDADVLRTLQTGDVPLLTHVAADHESAAWEVIAEDAWPFELVACSDAKGMKLMLEHSRAMLRRGCKAFDEKTTRERHLCTVATTYMTLKIVEGKQKQEKPLEELLENILKQLAASEDSVDEFRKWLVRHREALPERLAVTIFAPKGPALRLAKSISDAKAAKVKDLATLQHWVRLAEAEIRESPKATTAKQLLSKTKVSGATAAARPKPTEVARPKAKPPVPKKTERQAKEEKLKRVEQVLAAAARRADIIKRYLDIKAVENNLEGSDVDTLLQSELSLRFDQFREEINAMTGSFHEMDDQERKDYNVVIKWDLEKDSEVWYPFGSKKLTTTAAFIGELQRGGAAALETKEGKKKAVELLFKDKVIHQDIERNIAVFESDPRGGGTRGPLMILASEDGIAEGIAKAETEITNADIIHLKRGFIDCLPQRKPAAPTRGSGSGSGGGAKSGKKEPRWKPIITDSSSGEETDSNSYASGVEESDDDISTVDLDSESQDMDSLSLEDERILDGILARKVLAFRKVYDILYALREFESPVRYAKASNKIEKSLVYGTCHAISGFATVAAVANKKACNNPGFLIDLYQKERMMMGGSLTAQLFYAANFPGSTGAPEPRLSFSDADSFVSSLCAEMEKTGSEKFVFLFWSAPCIQLLLLRSAGLKEGQEIGAEEAQRVKNEAATVVHTGLTLLAVCGRLTAPHAREIALWVQDKLSSAFKRPLYEDPEDVDEPFEHVKADDEDDLGYVARKCGLLSLRGLERLATYVCYVVGMSFSSFAEVDIFQAEMGPHLGGGRLALTAAGSGKREARHFALQAADWLPAVVSTATKPETLDALDNDRTGIFSLWATHLDVIEKDKPAGKDKAPDQLEWLPPGAAIFPSDPPLDFAKKASVDSYVELSSAYMHLVSIVRTGAVHLESMDEPLYEIRFLLKKILRISARPTGILDVAAGLLKKGNADIVLLRRLPECLRDLYPILAFSDLLAKCCVESAEIAAIDTELLKHAQETPKFVEARVHSFLETLCDAAALPPSAQGSPEWAEIVRSAVLPVQETLQIVEASFDVYIDVVHSLRDVEDAIVVRLGAFSGQLAAAAATVPVKSAFALLVGRVLPRIWDKEMSELEKVAAALAEAQAAEEEQKKAEKLAAKAAEAEAAAAALLAEEEAVKAAADKKEAKKKKKKAKKAAAEGEEPTAAAETAEEKAAEEEEAAAAPAEEEEAGGDAGDDDGMGDLIGMFAARSATTAPPPRPAPVAPPPPSGPREKAPPAKIIAWDGKWQCRCLRTHALDSRCSKCEVALCVPFVEGRPCATTPCKKVHPAFSITTRRPPPSMGLAEVRVRNTAVWTKADQVAHAASRKRQRRVITWQGKWICGCGEVQYFHDDCKNCGTVPCRDSMRGVCKKGAACRFPHLPLDLDSTKRPSGKDVIVRITELSVMWHDGAGEEPEVPGAAAEEQSGGASRRGGRGEQPRVVEVQRVQKAPRPPAPAAAAPAAPAAPAADSGVSSEGWGFAGAPVAPAHAPTLQLQPPQHEHTSLFSQAGAHAAPAAAGGWPTQQSLYGAPAALPAAPAAAGWDTWASAAPAAGFMEHLLPTTSADSEASVSLPLGGLDFQAPAAAAPAVDDGYDDMLADLGVAPEAPAWRAAVMTSVTDELSKLAAPGLANEAGEYNCFLNVVVQCLWHCFEFRKRVMSWPPELYEADPVVAALRSLFAAFADLEAEMEGGASADARRAVVDPAVLRHALAAYPGGSFGLGEMNDAAELLMTLYGCAQEVGGAAAEAVDAVFGLRVRESVSCPKCRTPDGSPLETHQNEYVQYFFNVSTTALRTMRAVQGAAASTAFLLRRIEEQTQKSCDTDHGGCDARLPVRHALTDPPAVFTLQLAWETTAEAPEDIRATMEAVQETVRLPELYADVQASSPVKAYKLRAAVAYYGAHYSALVYSPRVKGWVMLDDASVSKVGRWDDVVRKCQAGRIQPSVLFYVREG